MKKISVCILLTLIMFFTGHSLSVFASSFNTPGASLLYKSKQGEVVGSGIIQCVVADDYDGRHYAAFAHLRREDGEDLGYNPQHMYLGINFGNSNHDRMKRLKENWPLTSWSGLHQSIKGNIGFKGRGANFASFYDSWVFTNHTGWINVLGVTSTGTKTDFNFPCIPVPTEKLDCNC